MKNIITKIYNTIFPKWTQIEKHHIKFKDPSCDWAVPVIYVEISQSGKKRAFVETVNGRKYYDYNYVLAALSYNKSVVDNEQ